VPGARAVLGEASCFKFLHLKHLKLNLTKDSPRALGIFAPRARTLRSSSGPADPRAAGL